jgi:predicted metal-dependent hydrolase
MLDRLFNFKLRPEAATGTLQVGARTVSLHLVRHPRARRYVMRLRGDGTVRVTVPRAGTISAAMAFASRNLAWLEKQLRRQTARPQVPATWHVGMEIFFRGELVRLELADDGCIRFGGECLGRRSGGSSLASPLAIAGSDLRPAIQKHLRWLAGRELPARVMEFAALHGMTVNRVTVRNQKSRWGSCSRSGTISLNWRLIQAPPSVRDYIILHELAHRRQMNHSEKFWAEVARLCPDYSQAEHWLKRHSHLLR